MSKRKPEVLDLNAIKKVVKKTIESEMGKFGQAQLTRTNISPDRIFIYFHEGLTHSVVLKGSSVSFEASHRLGELFDAVDNVEKYKEIKGLFMLATGKLKFKDGNEGGFLIKEGNITVSTRVNKALGIGKREVPVDEFKKKMGKWEKLHTCPANKGKPFPKGLPVFVHYFSKLWELTP